MSTPPEQSARARRLAEIVLDRRAEDVVALDVRAITSFADTFVLATGTSDRHVRSVADALVEAAKAAGEKPLGVEGYDDGRWVLIDLGDVVIHLFRREVREYYDLDRLWADAPRIDVDPEARHAGSAG